MGLKNGFKDGPAAAFFSFQPNPVTKAGLSCPAARSCVVEEESCFFGAVFLCSFFLFCFKTLQSEFALPVRIRPHNKYRTQTVTFLHTISTKGKTYKKSRVCSTRKQMPYGTTFTGSFGRLVAQSLPRSQVSICKHHFCHLMAEAPHAGS